MPSAGKSSKPAAVVLVFSLEAGTFGTLGSMTLVFAFSPARRMPTLPKTVCDFSALKL